MTPAVTCQPTNPAICSSVSGLSDLTPVASNFAWGTGAAEVNGKPFLRVRHVRRLPRTAQRCST